MKITEDNYIALMKKGNQDALKYFIEHHGWRVQSIVSKKLASFPNEQEACINEIFYAIWSNIKKYDDKKGSFNTWIAAISKYVILNNFRKLKDTLNEESIEVTGWGNEFASWDTNDELENESFEELIACLSEEDRILFRMIYLHGKDSSQISESTGMKKENIYNRISRGKQKIKRSLVVMAILALVTLVTVFNPQIRAFADDVISYFTGNTKSEYGERVNLVVKATIPIEKEPGIVEVLEVARIGKEVHLRIKFDFGEDVSELEELCKIQIEGLAVVRGQLVDTCGGHYLADEGEFTISDDGKQAFVDDFFGERTYEMGEPVYLDSNSPEYFVLDTPPFEASTLTIDDKWEGYELAHLDVPMGLGSDNPDVPFSGLHLRNEEVSGNTLIQHMVLYLKDSDYQEDILVSIGHYYMELGERAISGEWKLDYTIRNAGFFIEEPTK